MAPSLNGPNGACLSGKPGVAPLQGFVQELIRRSRTSGTVLQTALCYIEAVRRKLPEIASASAPPRKETTHEGSSQDSELPSPEPPIPSPLLCPPSGFPHIPDLGVKISPAQVLLQSSLGETFWSQPREVGRCEKALGDALEWRLWVGKQSGKPLARSRSHVDQSFGTTNVCESSSRTIGRSRTLPSIGTECSNVQTLPVALTPPKLDPY